MGLIYGRDRGVAGFEKLAAFSPDHRPHFSNIPFPRQSGTMVSGFAGTIEAISQLLLVARRG
jgi:hypothetical protein